MDDFSLIQEIREIIHGLGEKRPRIDSMIEFQSVLVRQMAILIYQAKLEADKRCHKNILVKHVLYVLRDCKLTIIRLLRFYMVKSCIHKFTASHSQYMNDNEHSFVTIENDKVENKSISFNEAVLESESAELDSNYLDPMCLATINFKSESLRVKSKCIYKKLLKAILELKLDIKITKEEIQKTIEAREIRVNNLSLVLSFMKYDAFEICRSKNFINKKGDVLLNEVHKALPPKTSYDKNVKELLLFLAKETIASVYDLVYENRSNSETNGLGVTEFLLKEDLPKLKRKKVNVLFQSVLVEEITKVTDMYWEKSYGDLRIPYAEGDHNFLRNRLIFQ